ncbi:LOW QUALITY PROTEIN: OPT oligopeptide transporter protein-domain-containing protein [Jimgerdemannia flammicorona]|uniref:OPT oligopeptide transporter protein-domain-containing protein n=1 Tax=Jimgerdemannia flammicorona TaxID=994334 RepID=A0A433DCE4_9FUNG|nr:LOW QUALITY PROTEIN: OPT oligopeptide transporter protein-domain-containing protein [Jimgerdemannia flammicorona]
MGRETDAYEGGENVHVDAQQTIDNIKDVKFSEKNGDEVVVEEEAEYQFPEETHQFTWRAAIVGSLLGCFVAASNMYLGLKIGWSFGARWDLFRLNIPYSISISNYPPTERVSPICTVCSAPFSDSPFSNPCLKNLAVTSENATVQAAATCAGGLWAGFISAIPAMYRLGLLTDVDADMVSLTLWTISAAFFGLFFAVPLRKHFVIKQDMAFPTRRAAAVTIQAMHRLGGDKEASRLAKVMGVAFAISFIFPLVSFWVGITDTIHFLYWFGTWSGNQVVVDADLVWRWSFNFDWSFFGAGFMTSGSTVWSFFGGQFLAYGLAGPLMLNSGYLKAAWKFDADKESAQAWFLWPGVCLMVFTTLAEVAIHAPSFYRGLRQFGSEIIATILKDKTVIVVEDDNDPAPPEEQIPTWWWLSGALTSALLAIIIFQVYFKVPWYETLIAVILSFFLSFVGVQSSGQTDINPVSAVGKVNQLIFARFPAPDLKTLQMTNLSLGNLAACAAAQAADMVGDLKTGHILRASPRSQFLAQAVGSVFAVAIAVPLFRLYAKAYPCILQANTEKCDFAMVSATTWAAVTQLLTENLSVPHEAIIFSAVCAVLSVANVLVRHFLIPEVWHPYWINLNAVGIGFINTTPETPIAMITKEYFKSPPIYQNATSNTEQVITWTIGVIWRWHNSAQHGSFHYAVSAGLIGGVGIAGIIKAILKLSGLGDATVVWGCPPGGC